MNTLICEISTVYFMQHPRVLTDTKVLPEYAREIFDRYGPK